MHMTFKAALAVSAITLASQAMAQATFYEGEGFRGRAFTTNGGVPDFGRIGFNDRASSVVIDRGRWEACEDARYGGRCVLLRPGNYPSLASLGMENRLSSVRPAGNRRRFDSEPQPVAGQDYQYRRRGNEAVFEAPVTSARAVMGAANERCWIERQQVAGNSTGGSVGGTVAGALIGGVLGHQVGGGTGRDVATVGGAVAGGVIGNRIGSGSNDSYSQDVRKCETTRSGTPAYWDVTYSFRGREHQVQMASAPGVAVFVNGDGEPRQ